MKQLIITIIAFFIATSGYHVAFSFFSDDAQSTTNTFAAAEVFPTAVLTATPTPANIADHVVISEVQITGGPGNTTHDLIELYNPTNVDFDLQGHRLVKRSGNSPNDSTIKSWTTSTLIPAHGFYLWASSNDDDYPASINADTFTKETLGSDSSIALRQGPENTGVLIDVLSWNSGSTLSEGSEFDPDPGAGQSMERKANSSSTSITMTAGGIDEFKGNAYDTDNNSTDFILRSSSQPQNTSNPTETP